MATLDPKPFGEPALLLGSSLLSTPNNTATFTPNGLLDAGPFSGNGGVGEGENASSAQSPPWGVRPDEIGPADDDEPSAFTTNGLLDGPTQMTSTIISFGHLCGVSGTHREPRSDVFNVLGPPREPLF
jgi:hypothetical protein